MLSFLLVLWIYLHVFEDGFLILTLFYLVDNFPSSYFDMDPLESFTSTFGVIHLDFGSIPYPTCTGSLLAAQDFSLFDAMYVVPKKKGQRSLVPIHIPILGSVDWLLLDKST